VAVEFGYQVVDAPHRGTTICNDGQRCRDLIDGISDAEQQSHKGNERTRRYVTAIGQIPTQSDDKHLSESDANEG